MADDAESTNTAAGNPEAGPSNCDPDITNNPHVVQAKNAGELARQIYLQACAEEMRSASAAERHFFEMQARKAGNEAYLKELKDALTFIEAEKQQLKDLIRDVEDETKEIDEELEQLKRETNE